MSGVKEIGESVDIDIEELIYRLHREGEPWQIAELIGALQARGLTQKEIGKKLRMCQYEVSRYKRLLNLTPKLFDALKKGRIAKSTGYELSKLSGAEQNGFAVRLRGEDDRITHSEAEKFRKQQAVTDEILDAIAESPSVGGYANSHNEEVTCPYCGRHFNPKRGADG